MTDFIKTIAPSLITNNQNINPNSSPNSSIKLDYHNGTNYDITVCERNGLKINLPSTFGLKDYKLTIVLTIVTFYNVNINMESLLNDIGFPLDKHSSELYNSPICNDQNGFWNGNKRKIIYEINQSELREYGGCGYIAELDKLIYLTDTFKHGELEHPFSLKNSLNNIKNKSNETVSSFNFSIKVVDNDGVYGPKYINLLNEIYFISPIKNLQLKSGIYICKNIPTLIEKDSTFNESIFFTFEQINNLKILFSTKEEALTLGDPKLFFELEQEKIKLEALKIKKKLEQEESNLMWQKLNLDRKKMNYLNEEIDYNKKELIVKEKIQTSKINNEKHINNLKLSNEIIKTVPVIITCFLGLMAFFNIKGKNG